MHTVLGSIQGLVKDRIKEPKAYTDAFNLLANGGANAGNSLSDLSVFEWLF